MGLQPGRILLERLYFFAVPQRFQDHLGIFTTVVSDLEKGRLVCVGIAFENDPGYCIYSDKYSGLPWLTESLPKIGGRNVKYHKPQGGPLRKRSGSPKPHSTMSLGWVGESTSVAIQIQIISSKGFSFTKYVLFTTNSKSSLHSRCHISQRSAG